MAGIFIHLATSKRYIEKHSDTIADPVAFMDGAVLPDLTDNKEHTHYGSRKEVGDMATRMREKIDLRKFLQMNPDDTDLNRGKFLHLYIDQEYYNSFLTKEYLDRVDMLNFIKDNVYSNARFDKYVEEHYNVTFASTSIKDRLDSWYAGLQKLDTSRWGTNWSGEILFSKEEMNAFIERISDVDLVKLRTEIMEG